MAWEARGKRRYYTRSRRVDGRVVRQYVGTGARAEVAAAEDARQREERRAQDEAIKAEQERWDAADQLTDSFAAVVRLVVEASLTAAGYRQHDRGTWRRTRHDADGKDTNA